jgi:hypothetical protein
VLYAKATFPWHNQLHVKLLALDAHTQKSATVQLKLAKNCLIQLHAALVTKVAETRVLVAPAEELLTKDGRECFKQKCCILHTVTCFSDYRWDLDW